MKKQLFTLMLGAAVLATNPSFGMLGDSLVPSSGHVAAKTIVEVESIEQIPFSKYTPKDFLGFDLDDTTFIQEQKIMRNANLDARKAFLDEIRDQEGNERVLFAYDNSKYQLVEEDLKAEVDKLNERKVTTFGFTARRTGKAIRDQKSIVEDDTLRIINQLNVNFHSNYFQNMTLDGMNPNNPTYATNIVDNRLRPFELPHDAMVKEGVIFTNNIDKGLVVGEVFKRSGVFPEIFGFVDDKKENLTSVEEAIKKINEKFTTTIKFEGYHYKRALKLDNTLNPDVVNLQKAELLKKDPRFLSEQEALQQLLGQ